MSITINGSGTITGISAGGLPDDCITTDDIAANAVTTAKLGSNEASGLCKAWVNFNGTSTVTIRAQYNVSSITDNGTGDYTVNFATALADANGGVTAGTWRNTTSTPDYSRQTQVYQDGASAIRVVTYDSSTTKTDHFSIHVAIFR
jgi:hypothetical protein